MVQRAGWDGVTWKSSFSPLLELSEMVFNGNSGFSAWVGTAENRKPLTAAVIIKLETYYDQLFVFLSVNFPLQCI